MLASRRHRVDRPSRWSAFRRIPLTVHGGALLFLGVMIGFLVLYPTFYGFDEPQHVDRVYAVTDGELIPAPAALVAEGIAVGQDVYVKTWPYVPDHSYVDESTLPRGDRPSLIDMGAHAKVTPGGYPNQLTEHPPAYYLLLGGVMWLVPGDASLPLDEFVFVLRTLNILMLAPLPYLMWWGTRKLTGEGPAAQAAAFVPALIPGLARLGATVNNDNLLVLVGTALIAFLAGVMKGDRTTRTACWVAVLTVIGLLTKATALLLPLLVGAAYLVGWWRTRGRPPWAAVGIVVLGGAVGGLWWLRNLLVYDTLRPSGWGSRLAMAVGPPRLPGDPPSGDFFVDYVREYLPSRFWGGLGLIEPPELPGWTTASLGWLSLGCLVICLLFARRNRAPIFVLTAGLVVSLLLTVNNAWTHFQSYTIIPAVQGRYSYPFLLAIAVVIGIGLSLALGPLRRLTPLVVLAMALVAEYLAADAVVAHIWLPTGQEPRPGNVDLAFDTIERFAPFSPLITASLLGAVVIAVVLAIVLTVRAAFTGERGEPPPAVTSDERPRTPALSPIT